MTDPIVSLFIPGRPLLVNAERSAHWRVHRAETRNVRTMAMLLWTKERRRLGGPLERVKVDVYPSYAGGQLPDTGACLPAVKAIIDGAVDATLLEHDGPTVVCHLAFHRPRIDGDLGDGVMVVMEEIEEGSPWAE